MIKVIRFSLIGLLALISIYGYGQATIIKGTGVWYTSGIPGTPRLTSESELDINIANGSILLWNRTSNNWKSIGERIDIKTDTLFPSSTPGYGENRFRVNGLNRLYFWTGSNWVLVGGSGGGTSYTAGTGINITGVTITNTGDLSNTNELVTTFAKAGSNLILIDAGGTKSIPLSTLGLQTVSVDGTTIGGDGTSGDPLYWIGASTLGPVTGSGTSFFPITLLNNSIDSIYLKVKGVALKNIAQETATNGQVLKWNGTKWYPANDLTGGTGAAIDSVVVKTTGGLLVVKVNTVSSTGVKIPLSVMTDGTVAGQVSQWDGSGWVASILKTVNYETVTTNSTTMSGSYSIVYCNIATVGSTITLPLDANVKDGYIVTIYNMNSNALDVNRNGSNQTINAATAVLDIPQYGHITLHAKVTGPTIQWFRHE